MDIAKVVSAEIVEATGFHGNKQVVAKMSDEEECMLFSYYDDEIQFQAVEFIGMTKDDALEHFRRRDVAYLQSEI